VVLTDHPFFVASRRLGSSCGGVTRLHLRILLGICLLFSIAFAAWGWLRPYDWHPDPAASGKIIAAEVIEDHSRYWLTVHVELLPGQEHDLLDRLEKKMSLDRENIIYLIESISGNQGIAS